MDDTKHNQDPPPPAPAAPACCPPGSIDDAKVLYDRPIQGHMVEISLDPSGDDDKPPEPMPCYCTGCPLSEATTVVAIFTDVYGIDAGHHKVFADLLAEEMTAKAKKNNGPDNEKKVSVIIPDIQRGIPILQPWINDDYKLSKDLVGSFLGSPGMVYRLKYNYKPAKVERDIFELILPWIKLQQAPQATAAATTTKLGCVGFCFGGWVVGRILGYDDQTENNDDEKNRLQFQCGVGIHPSFQPNVIHGELPTTMAQRITKPILLLPAWNDIDMKPGTKVVNILASNAIERRNIERSSISSNDDKKEDDDEEEAEEPPVSIEFPSQLHGWVSRGNPNDPQIAAEQKRALQLTVEFLTSNMK